MSPNEFSTFGGEGVTYLTALRAGDRIVGISICGCGFWRNGTTHVVRKGKFKEFLGQSGFPYLDSNGAIRHIHCPFVLPEVKFFSNFEPVVTSIMLPLSAYR